MKDYKRLTEKCGDCFRYCLKDHKAKIGEFNDYEAFFDYSMAVKRLGELEDKIESGELGDVSEYKHRAEVAERALNNAVRDRNYLAKEFYSFVVGEGQLSADYYLKQAEKELQEERGNE